MKLKTLTIIILAILVVAGIFFYIFSRQGKTPVTTATTTTGSLPGTGAQSFSGMNTAQTTGASTNATGTSQVFGIVSNDPTLAYFVDSQNNATIVEPNGSIETITNGAVTILSSTTIPNVISASFSYDGKKVLINSGNTTSLKTSIFDITVKSWLPLPLGMESPVWSPVSYQIAYLNAESGGSETIFIGTLNGASEKITTVENLTMEDSMLQWPTKNILIISDKPSAFTVSSALSLNLSAKTVTSLAVELPGMESIWNKGTSNLGLVFSGNTGDQGGSLMIVDGAGSKKLLTFATLPSKCLFNLDTTSSTESVTTTATKASSSTTPSMITVTTSTLDIYCAVPRDQDTFSIARLPDEYDQKVFFTTDDFYSVNSATGAMTSIFADPNQTLDGTDLKIFNGILFFVNRYDQKLYAIKLGESGVGNGQ